eukprot:Plantae.Rhodophyta-Purpureofilum_apyrenoidigerum.ctg13806.p1 GENE.Plantae.Rhodophyta-Purpureofilum_apyrenoidigerum.ctg13806~~Plantae.Rhodophyta-Purpureofilum_apyrenoidigerum.ctg13806.p1  ORF type:complete len:635 (+),score=147.38 Plantae.Rhodophyta-Purpureofilum_apyrenoidigerum.ctg13806:134-1906(+)
MSAAVDLFGLEDSSWSAYHVFFDLEQSIKPSAASFNALIKFFALDGNINQMLEITRKMKERGLSEDIITCNTLLSAFAKANNVDFVRRTLERMDRLGINPNIVTLNILLKMYMKRSDLDAALNCMASMGKLGLKPTVATYNILIDIAAASKDMRMAELALKEIKYRNLQPMYATFNGMLRAAASCQSVEGIRVHLRNMSEAGFNPNKATCAHVVNACRAAATEKGKSFLDIMSEVGLNLTRALVEPMVKTVASWELDHELRNFWMALSVAGITATTEDYSAAINVCSKWKAANGVSFLMREMKRARFEPSLNEYCALIEVLSAEQNIGEMRRIFDEHVQNRLDGAHASTLNRLVELLIAVKDVQRAKQVVWKLSTVHAKLPVRHFNALLKLCADEGQADDLISCYEMVDEDKVCPNIVSFNKIMDSFVTSGNQKGAEAVLDELCRRKIRPNIATFNTLLKMYARKSELENADRCLQLMEKEGFRPNAISFNTMMDACSKSKDLKKVEQLYREMIDRQISPTIVSYNILLTAYMRAGDVAKAEEVFAGISPDTLNRATYTSMALGYVQNGLNEKARALTTHAKYSGITLRL